MSTSRVVKLLDHRLGAKSENMVSYVVKEGAQTISYIPLQSSSHSIQSTTFNLNNIGTNTCRDSRLDIVLTGTVTLNVTNTDNANPHPAIVSDNFGFKRWGVNAGIQSVQHVINEASYTLSTNDILDAISRLNSHSERLNYYDNTQPDLIDDFKNATGTPLTPLNSYSSSQQGDGVWKGRTLNWSVVGGFAANNIPQGATQNVVINWKCVSPLITPYTNCADAEMRGLYAINGELITINYVFDLFNNMFNYWAPPNITLNSGVVSFAPTATLNTIYLTPYESLIDMLPQNSVYHYNAYSQFTNTIGSCAPKSLLNGGAVSSQVCNFTNVPDKILVYARLSNGSRTAATPDKYLQIQNVTVQWDNGLPNLQSATNDQLWQISKRNGLNMDRACFRQDCLNQAISDASNSAKIYGCGSVLVIDPVLDLSIRPGASTGTSGRYIFQVQNANFFNNTDTAFPSVTLFVVGISAGVLERSGSQYRSYLLSLPQDVLDGARDIDPVSYDEYLQSGFNNAFLSGGSLSRFLKKAYNAAKQGVSFGLKNKDDIMKGAQLAQKLYNQVLGAPKKGKGGAINPLVSNFRDMHPSRNMDLFYE
jgi:hypothetical protein